MFRERRGELNSNVDCPIIARSHPYVFPEAALEPTPAPKARRKQRALPWWVTIPTILVVLAGFAGLLYFASLPKNGVHAEQLDADVREGLQVGTSTREDAMAWFAARGITEVSDTSDAGGRKNGYLAKIPNDSWMKQKQVEIQIGYDGKGKVMRLSVYETQRSDAP